MQEVSQAGDAKKRLPRRLFYSWFPAFLIFSRVAVNCIRSLCDFLGFAQILRNVAHPFIDCRYQPIDELLDETFQFMQYFRNKSLMATASTKHSAAWHTKCRSFAVRAILAPRLVARPVDGTDRHDPSSICDSAPETVFVLQNLLNSALS
jgi:hypothetical protein